MGGQEDIDMDKGYRKPYRVLTKGGQGEITEKKSRFIATLAEVEKEEEAAAFIEKIKKQYWDAKHHCSAFIIGRDGGLRRCSDDGEPQGTAGKPMLEVLEGSGIRNIAVVVTRYFGGTLLGTGGLIRAYTRAVQEGLSDCETALMRYGCRMAVTADYNTIGKILYILAQKGIEQEKAEYTDSVCLQVMIPEEETENVERELTEATGGRVRIDRIQECYYIDKK